jgi:hypothetical protein
MAAELALLGFVAGGVAAGFAYERPLREIQQFV